MPKTCSYKETIRKYKITNELSIQLIEIPKISNFPKCVYCGEGECWNVSCETGLALSRYLAREFIDGRLNGLQALDLGCGVGLSGLVLAKLGATVSFLDHIPDALQVVHRNCMLNGVKSIETICCCWRNSKRLKKIGKYDILIGSDVLYNESTMFWIISFLTTNLKRNGIAIFADPMRYGVMAFFRLLAKSSFQFQWHWIDSKLVPGNDRVRVYFVKRS
jgi:2-polyprenyl-3-methyl-5-hydroxy-6-metoxy-1,4-benzoquinol methylase